MMEAQIFVVQSKKVQNCGVQVPKVNFSINSSRSGVISAAMDISSFCASSSKPEGETAGVMAGFILAITGDKSGSAEFATPNYQGIIK